jgi:hypothetical protein
MTTRPRFTLHLPLLALAMLGVKPEFPAYSRSVGDSNRVRSHGGMHASSASANLHSDL